MKWGASICDICRQTPCSPRCPNYVETNKLEACSICKDWIVKGDKYIVNDDSMCAHLDCLENVTDLAKWLGYDVKTAD